MGIWYLVFAGWGEKEAKGKSSNPNGRPPFYHYLPRHQLKLMYSTLEYGELVLNYFCLFSLTPPPPPKN